MATLDLSRVADLPQKPLLAAVAAELFADDTVRGLWLGGSLAHGEGDAYSDIDLRVALSPDAFADGALPACADTLIRRRVAGLVLPFDTRVLHHLMLDTGAIFDLLLQPADIPPAEEIRLVLGVKDDALADRLHGGADPPPQTFEPIAPDTLAHLLQSFWIGQQKHLKVLARGLPLVAWQGEHFLRVEMLKLLFIDATGCDCGNATRSIHVLSPVARAIQNRWGEAALALLGTPRTTTDELAAHAYELQNAVATLGRELCQRHGAPYPEAAEATVRRNWDAYFEK